MDYVFTDASANVLNINALKVSLAAQRGALEKVVNAARARAVNITTLPTSPSNGYVALFNKTPTGIWAAYPAYMAIYIPYVLEGGAWLLVSSNLLGNVAQDYRAAQYSLSIEASGWVEVVTDASAEGIGPAGPRGPSGASNVVTKTSISVTFPGSFASGRWISNEGIRSAVDDGESVTGFIPASIHLGHPVVHVIPVTGAPYYQILRESLQDGSGTVPPGIRATPATGVGDYADINRRGSTFVSRGDRVRYVGMCVTTRTIETTAQNTNGMPFRYSPNITIRQDELRVTIQRNFNEGPFFDGVLLYFQSNGVRYHYFGLVSTVPGRNFSRIRFSNGNGVLGIPASDGPAATVQSFSGPDASPGATSYFTFSEKEEYHAIGIF